jgi:hypothetical protein
MGIPCVRWAIRWLSAFAFIALIGISPVFAGECVATLTAADGFRIRNVKIEARWGWVPKFDLPIRAGDRYDPATVSAALEVVNQAVKGENRGQELADKTAVAVFYATTCTEIVGDRLVDVTFRVYSVRLDLANPAASVLPLPRSNRPTFFSEVPKPLRIFNPTFDVGRDRAAGTSAGMGISTDLLNLPALAAGKPTAARPTRLTVEAQGRKSFENPFYDAETAFGFSRTRTGKVFERFFVEGRFSAARDPRGAADFSKNAAFFNIGAGFRPTGGFLRRIVADGRFQWSRNRFDMVTGPDEKASEPGFGTRVVADGRIAGGFARGAVWFDGGFPDGRFNSYRRVVATVGYAGEIGVSKNTNQTLGVEIVTGFGRVFGNAPRYARFYGGNGLNRFLYDSPDSQSLTATPTGPLIRSFGAGQAGADGATGFWHFNLNLAVPIPKLSRPLIPNLDLNEGNDPPILLRKLLKKSTGSARSFLINQFLTEGASQAEAERRAHASLRGVQPTVDFLADRANLYAVKPLFLFDVANVRGMADAGPRTRFGIGGGVQFTLVIARFEVGYLRTVRALPGDNKGNFFLRLTFQNLF